MEYKNNYFCVNYTENEKKYISELLETLNKNISSIMDFFEIKEFKQKKIIKFWNNLKDYVKYIKPYVSEYQDWMVADTFDNNINILSFDLYISSEAHKNSCMAEYKKIIIHEFVHACQQEVNSDANKVFWFWEALATNLSKQNFPIVNVPYSKKELIHDFRQLNDIYSVSYTIGLYLLENYSRTDILGYVKNPSKLIDDTESILEGTYLWIQYYNN